MARFIAQRPWLGIAVMLLVYGAVAAMVANDHIGNQDFTASPAQLGVAAAVVVALVAAAFLIPRRPTGLPGWLPRPWSVGLAALAVLTTYQMTPETWAGFGTDVLALAALGALLLYGSTRAGWGGEHVLLAAGVALLVNAVLGFVVQPLGDPDMTLKYVSNTAFTLGVLVLVGWGFLRVRRAETPAALTSPLPGEPLERESR